MGGQGSGRRVKGSKEILSTEEKIERNRTAARERWRRLKEQKENGESITSYQKYRLNTKIKHNKDEERLAYLRESSKSLKVTEDPKEYLQYLREKNRNRLDEILNDVEAMERIFADREDISAALKANIRKRDYYSSKEIAEMERKLNEEFNTVEDRRPSQRTYKKTTEDDTR
jgi:hypothetical protein